MASFLDLPASNAALKEHYEGQQVLNLAYKKNTFLTMVPKLTDMTGKYYPIPVIFETSQGGSSAFATAQGNQTPMLIAEFSVPVRPDYHPVTIGNQAMKAAGNKVGSFIDLATKFIDVGIQSLANRQGSAMYRAGTGSRGGIGTIVAGVVTLTNPADVVQFGVNQTLQASSTDGGAPRAAQGFVIGRNTMAGTITLSATALGGAAGTPAGWVAADFLLAAGDSNATMNGLAAWLPTVAPGAGDNFNGVNRSSDSRLYGLAYPGSNQSAEECLIDAAMLLAREKGSPGHFLTNYGTYSSIVKALGTRRLFNDWKSEDGVIGFRGCDIEGPDGTIQMFADRNCQTATGWLLQMDTWKLLSLDAVPHIDTDGDGMQMLRVGNADACEARIKAYSNLACEAPGWNSQITFNS